MNKNKRKYDLNFYEQAIQDMLDKSNYGFIGKQAVRYMMTSTIISPANAEMEWFKGIRDYSYKPDTTYVEIDEDDWNKINKVYGNRASYASIDEFPKYDPLKPDFHRLFLAKPGSIRKKISINYTQDLLNSIKVGINIQVGG